MKNTSAIKGLPPEKLYQRIDPRIIPFDTTKDCKACEGIIGQEQALKSIQTGLDIKSLGYNIFITGMVGTGRTTTIMKFLEKLEISKEVLEDLLYVNNFKTRDEPTLIILPAGQGNLFKDAMENLIGLLKVDIPEMLKSKYYTEKRDTIIEKQQKRQKEVLKKFETDVAKEGFSVIQVQIGTFVKPDLIPIIEDGRSR